MSTRRSNRVASHFHFVNLKLRNGRSPSRSAPNFSMPTPADLLKDLMLIQKRLNTLFDEPETSFAADVVATNTAGCWIPVVDCYETDDKYAISAELPGVAQEDIDLHVQNRRIVLSGKRKPSEGVARDKYHRVECASGKFQRTFEVSQEIDSTRVEAKLSDGVLRIILPKKSSSVRQIAVEREE